MRVQRSAEAGFYLLCLYCVLLILLPSGSVRGINVKMIVVVPVAIFAVERSVKGSRRYNELAAGLSILGVFLGWIFLSQAYAGFDLRVGLDQYKDVGTTLGGCWFIRIFTSRFREMKSFLRVCLFTLTASSVLKLGILLYSSITGTSVTAVMNSISGLFGVQLMTIDVAEGLGRVQFTSDTLIPMAVFAILCLRDRLHIRSVMSTAMLILFLLSSFETFSRFIWFYTVAAVVLGFIVAEKNRLHLIYIGLIGAATAFYFDAISVIVGLRFSAEQAGSSDSDRITQNVALQRFFMDAPFFGHGLGSYSTQVVRSLVSPYSYELQVLALLGQVGLVGMTIFILLIVSYYSKAFTFRRGTRLYESSVLLLVLFYLAGGFVNPWLVSSTSAVSFGMLFVLARFARASIDIHVGANSQNFAQRSQSDPSVTYSIGTGVVC